MGTLRSIILSLSHVFGKTNTGKTGFLSVCWTVALLLTATNSFASVEFKVNDILYVLDESKHTASVKSNNRCSGDIVIEDTIVYNGVEYLVTSIGNDAFNGCSITSVVIPEGIVSIGSQSFFECRQLSSINLPSTVRNFAWRSFGCCSSIQSIVIPEGVTVLKDAMLYGCESLETVVLPSTLKTIENAVFHYDHNLSKINLPEGLESLQGTVFGECYSLDSIVLPTTLNRIDNSVFYGCSFTSFVNYSNLNAEYNNYWGAFSVIGSLMNGLIEFDLISKELIKYNGNATSFVLPNDIDKISPAFFDSCSIDTFLIADGATEISDDLFCGCKKEIVVIIPESVTSIGNRAFKNSKLLSIIIPSGVTNIGQEAFYNDSLLTSIKIPDGVKEIGNYTFYNNVALADLKIPSTLETIGDCAFSNCCSIESFELPDGLSSIGENAFSGCSSLTSIVIPSGVTSINHYTFKNCHSLTSVVIPESVTIIGAHAFNNDSLLSSIHIPDGVKEIGKGAFYNNVALADINIPSSLEKIGDYAFYNCSSLSSMNLNEGLTKIGVSAFYGCISLSSIVIPSTVTEIGYDRYNSTFGRCINLKEVIIKSPLIADDFYHIFREGYSETFDPDVWEMGTNGKRYLSNWKMVKPEVVVFPEGTTKIPDNSFSEMNNLKEFKIPSTVTFIGENAFRNCNLLASMNIPSGLTKIGKEAFRDCSSWASDIVIPEGVTSIKDYTFYNCSSITSLSLPNGITSIGREAFRGCSSLASDIVISDGVTSIGDYTFYNCSTIPSIVIPDGITKIGTGAFENCSSLSSMAIPESVTAIGDYAFKNCYSITRINIPSGVTSIGREAFRDCSLLASDIVIPEGVTTIGEFTFAGCSSIPSVSIPSSVTTIEGAAFWKCFSLKELIIPDGVTSIGHSAVKECTSLTSLVIPIGVTTLKEWMFEGTSNLARISISSKLTTINEYAFYHADGLKYLTIVGDNVADYEIYKNMLSRVGNILIFVNDGLYDQYASTPGWSDFSKYIVSADMLELKTVDLVANESRSSLFSEFGNNSQYVCNLKIRGTINAYDIMALRNKTIHLLYLDLSEAKIVANDGGYEYYSGCSLSADNVLGRHCFADLYLKEVILPDSLKSIEQEAFKGCKYLEKVVIGEGTKTIGREAFRDCNLLNEVNLPNSLELIDEYAFNNCKLGSVLVIPDKIVKIKRYSFNNCQGVDSIVIGSGVKEIEYEAFRYCSNLRSIKFNRKLSKIGGGAFSECRNLLLADLPYSVETIEARAFENCSNLTSLKIPSLTRSIGDRAFSGCNQIKNVYASTVEPISIDQNTFSCYTKAMLNVPRTSADLYIYDTKWSQFYFVQEYDETYDAFYLNGDFILNDSIGRLNGVPDAEMLSTSGFIVQGNSVQELTDVEITHNGNGGASIIASDGDETGNQVNLTAQSLKVNISVDGNRWYFFCFPFDVDLDSIECTTEYKFMRYDGNLRATIGSGWDKLPVDTKVLTKGDGYIFQTSRSGSLTIHVGSEYLNFTANNEKEMLHTYASNTISDASWNLIGNPFISYYDVQDLAHEYDAPIVVWNGNGYDAYKPGDDNYQLKPFEAVFVQKASDKPYVEFLPKNRITYNEAKEINALRARKRDVVGLELDPSRQIVNITIMNADSVTDRTRIVYNDKAKMDYEIGSDVSKFKSEGIPQVYTVNSGIQYAINERPMGADDIKLGYIAPKAGVYTLAVPRHDADVEIYDNVAGAVVDFTFGDYTFESAAGTFNDRFVIRKTGGVTAIENGFRLDGLTVKSTEGGLSVNGLHSGTISVYLPSGAKIDVISTDGEYSLPAGTYLINYNESDSSIKMTVI